jgi:DNA polymerase-3 subunit gamma/tau
MLAPMTAQKPEPYQVVARRFRPQAFAEVVGQESIQSSLESAIASGRIPHAFLFAGSRGVGKTTTARILARCLVCERGPTAAPCGKCALCRSVLDGSNPDVIEIDAASNNGVDEMRALRDRVAFAPMRSRYKVYILDEAHMLSKGAWNALLKTLEEPPPNVVFVLATTELHKVPETIRSRCQVLQFRRIGEDDIGKRLRMIADAEGVALGDDVLEEIAAGSRGGMRDAETALERALSLARAHGGKFDLAALREMTQRLGHDRAVEVAAALLTGDAAAGLHFCRELQQNGIDEREALGDLVEVLRSCQLLQIDGPDSALVDVQGGPRQQLAAMAASAGPHRLEAMIQAGLLGRERLRRLDDRAAVLQLAIVRMAQAGALPALGELVAAVRDGGMVAPAAAGAAGGAPAAAPRPAAPPAGGGDLRARVLAAAREQPLLAATLEQCRFEGPDGSGRVIVHVETDKKIYRDRLQAPAVQQQVVGFVQAGAGRAVQVEFRFAPQTASTAPPPASTAPPGPMAQRVMQRFGGRVVAVDPEDGARRPARGEPPPGPADAPMGRPSDRPTDGPGDPPPDGNGPGGDGPGGDSDA